ARSSRPRASRSRRPRTWRREPRRSSPWRGRGAEAMSILVDKNTRVLVSGITGSAGSFHADQCLAYGTNIVAGVTPGRGGQIFTGKESGKTVPVFDTIEEAVKQTGANCALQF